MQEHVHARQSPGGAVHFLPIEREIVGTDLFGRANEEGA
jgi:hypothetical protein